MIFAFPSPAAFVFLLLLISHAINTVLLPAIITAYGASIFGTVILHQNLVLVILYVLVIVQAMYCLAYKSFFWRSVGLDLDDNHTYSQAI